MTDPKFNTIPIEDTGDAEISEQKTTSRGTPRPGLSINDTVASNANLSVGGRGTDTSGVRAGAGAGAGTAYVTPGRPGESPAPNVVPAPTGSGTTPVSDYASGQQPTMREDQDDLNEAQRGFGEGQSGYDGDELTNDEIAAHAYRCWHERGCPEGSPEDDWHRAERELRERRQRGRASAASA